MKYNISWKAVCLVGGAELFHVDRQADGHDKAISRFSKFFERA